MSPIILTGLTQKGKHKLAIKNIVIEEEEQCFAVCTCGFEGRIRNPNNYAGIKELEKIWIEHVGNK
jgi:hypothetical protein